jgi:succinoglycan biosynthesis transport protein ExoP
MSNEFDYRKYISLIVGRKRLFAVVSLLIMTAAVITCYLLPKKYEAKSTIFIEKNIISELVKGIAVTPSMDETIKVLTYAITSRTLILKVIDDLGLNSRAGNDAAREEMIRGIQSNIEVKVKDKNLFIISFQDKDPRIARDFVNTLVQRYIEENISSKREESYGAIKFLSEQLDTYKEKLDKAESDLYRFKTDKGGVINVDEAKLFEEINVAQQKLYDIQLRRRHLEGLKPVVRKAGDPLQMKLLALQKQLQELRVEYTDNYPEVIKVRTDIETVKEQMKGRRGEIASVADSQELDKVEAELNALKINEEGLKRYIATNQSLLRSIPAAKAGLDKLELEKKSRKDLYDQLMARHGQSEVSKQMEVQDKTTTFRIVDPAVIPVKPASPNRVRLILLGIVAGIAGGVGVLVAIDRFNNTVKTVDSLKKFGVPVLAVIPKICDPKMVGKERLKDLRLYAVSGMYFAMIVALLALEVLNLSPVERIIEQIQVLL